MLVYTNNFPREGAIKGQEFSGDSKLKKELLERGIISDDGAEEKSTKKSSKKAE